MKIDYSAFEKAIVQLEKSMSFLNSEMAKENPDLREQFRAAAIQAFEFTYELAIKMVRRQLKNIVANASELESMDFMDLMRTAQEAGLVHNAPQFRIYREERDATSRTYDADKAEKIIGIIGSFLPDVKHVLNELKKRNNVTT